MKKDNLLSVQLLRFLAAISVIFYHYSFMFYQRGYTYTQVPLLWSFFHYGYLGVDLFFIISGFVIAMSAEGRPVGDFVVSRFARLFPVFWIAVILSSVFVLLFGNIIQESLTLTKFLSNLTMLPGMFGQNLIDGSAWSLAVELVFYVLIGLMLLFNLFKKINIIAFVVSLALFLDVVIFHFLSPNWVGYFTAGVLFYSIYRHGVKLIPVIGIVFSFVATLKYATLRAIDLSSGYHTHFDVQIIALHITAFYLIFFVISLKLFDRLKTGTDSNSKTFKIIFYLGTLTYPLYLLHQTIGHITLSYFDIQKVNVYVAYVVTVSFVFIISAAVNRYIDIPSRRFIQKQYRLIKNKTGF